MFGLRARGVLPGFGLTLGLTVFYLSLIVLIPLSALFWKTSQLTLPEFWKVVTASDVVAAYRVTFFTSIAAALVNTFFGLIVAWVLVRYRFPGRKLLDSLVDLPFALPTAVAGIALTALYAKNGWVGQIAARWDVAIAFTPLGIFLALTFIGLPFVVRTVQPILEDLDKEVEEAAASLGAGRIATFCRVIFPVLLPSLLTGFSLSFARALGEYGSVVFISGNLPYKTQIVPLMIINKLEQYEYAAATAIAITMLIASFGLLLIINLLQWWSGRRLGIGGGH